MKRKVDFGELASEEYRRRIEGPAEEYWKWVESDVESDTVDLDLDALRNCCEVDDAHEWGYELRLVNEPEYCGKLLILDSKESSSLHYHKEKKETFIVLAGTVFVVSPKVSGYFGTGETVTIWPRERHSFQVVDNTRAVILEVSTHHEDSDTYRV